MSCLDFMFTLLVVEESVMLRCESSPGNGIFLLLLNTRAAGLRSAVTRVHSRRQLSAVDVENLSA